MTKINFKNNKTKTATIVAAALIIGMTLLSSTTIMPNINAISQQKPFYLPNPILTSDEKQQLVNIAMDQPGIKAWSNQWQFSTINFKGEKTSTGVNWQEAIVFLRLDPSASAAFKCDQGWIAQVGIDMSSHRVLDSSYPTTQSHSCHGLELSSIRQSGPDANTFSAAEDNDVQSTSYYGNSAVLTTPSYSSTIFSNMDQGIGLSLNAEWNQSCSGPDANCFLQGGWLMTTPSHSVGGLPADSADIVFVDESVTGTEDAYNTNIAYSGGGTLAVGINCLAGGSTDTISMQFGTATYNDNSNVSCTKSETTSSENNSVFFENANKVDSASQWYTYVTGTVEATSASEYDALNNSHNWSSSSNVDFDCQVPPHTRTSTVINSGTTLAGGSTAIWGSLDNVLTAC